MAFEMERLASDRTTSDSDMNRCGMKCEGA